MNLANKFISYVKKVCKNDELCVMVVFVVIGFMLCYLFKDEINGFTLQGSPIDFGSDSGTDNVLANNQPLRSGGGDGQIGIELNKRTPEPTPSTERQLKAMANKPSVSGAGVGQQVPGLSVQDSMMFKPFDEVWNPGFMPLDMVFKNVQKLPVPSVAGPQATPEPKPSLNVPPPVDKPKDEGVKGDLKVILVYAPWCGHSKKMLPDYEKVRSEFDGQGVNGKQVSIIMYDSDVDKDKVKEYGVKGFPTLFVEKNGVREPFPHRSYDKIAEYIKNA